jgi:hypothetical protein
MRRILYGLAVVVVSGCSGDVLQPNNKEPNFATAEGCQLDPSCGPGVDGSVTGTTAANYVIPTDPSPGKPGIYVGLVAQDCYKNYGATLPDYDNDLLTEECEWRLAREFAPDLMMNPNDGCLQGEPYWAARYFDDSWGLGWGQFVRIAYLLSYYKDCGSNGHIGDSEIIVVRVANNPVTKHWEVVNVFTSAHFTTPVDYSAIHRWQDFYYRSGIQQSYPRVWVAKGKHANYNSLTSCNNGAYYSDSCTGNLDYGRVKVYKSHNIGGYNTSGKRLNCVPSQNKLYYLNGRLECFLTAGSLFKGWQTVGAGSATDYNKILNLYDYECLVYSSDFNACYWGPFGSRY